MRISHHIAAFAVTAAAVLSPANAAPVLGEYLVTYCCGTEDGPQVGAAANGLSYAGTVDKDNLTGVDIVVGGAYATQFTSWIAAGGAFIYHDWSPSHALELPGLAGVTGAYSGTSDINILSALSPIVNGPFGTLTNSNMDGGSSSGHGYVNLASLISSDPLVSNLTAIFSSQYAQQVTSFSYNYGLGLVIYSAMPIDAYSGSIPYETDGTIGLNILAKNEIAYAASFKDSSSNVPEPGSIALLGAGMLALAMARRKAGKAG